MLKKIDIGASKIEYIEILNSIVDTVNTIQKEREAERFEIQEWISIFEGVRKSVNKLETMAKNTNTVLESLVETKHEEPADEFAEQRKWIGKLCWFWDEDRDDAFCDVLGYIFESSRYPYAQTDSSDGYKHCEPVKPDDDVIYKGE